MPDVLNDMNMLAGVALLLFVGSLILTVVICEKAVLLDPLVRVYRAYMRLPVPWRLFLACFVTAFVGRGGAKNGPVDSGPSNLPRQTILRSATTAIRRNGTQLPTDTNRIAFVDISRDSLTTNLFFTLYAPEAQSVDIFGRVRLESGNWTYCGTVNAVSQLTEAYLPAPSNSYFLAAARADVDSDNDGIPDGWEHFLFHTNPLLWDSSGDGLSDGIKLYCGLDPLLRDSDQDGYDDDEEIATGQSPYDFTDGAGTTIRYVYDDDDRLVGGYSGESRGASTVTLTPAGNPSTLHERSAR